MTLPSHRFVRGSTGTPVGTITGAGRVYDGRGVPADRMRVLPGYAAVYLLSGHGRYADANGLEAVVEPGDLLLLVPGTGHTYGPRLGQGWNEQYVMFEGPVFDVWRDSGLLDPVRPVRHLEPIDHWAHELETITLDLRRAEPGHALGNVCRLLSLLAAAETATAPVIEPDDDQWLARARAMLEVDLTREVPLPDIAAQLVSSYDGFRKRFRRLAGMSPARYRSLRSIDRACELIAQGDLTNREIAAELGFADEAHFSHRFRSLAGTTPSQFRSSLPVAGSPR
jgi:AraC-like DNA-binding protein